MRKGMSKKIISLVIAASCIMSISASAADITKDETVYVNLDSDGNTDSITVSDWLHSNNGNINVKDKSDLDDIKNVKTDDEPDINGNILRWNVDSSDVYYQGKTNKKLPLDISIKYYLNGKRMDPENIAGKSGNIKIEIEFTNMSYKKKDINGNKRNIYTPFSTATVVTLPVDSFSNIKTDNGLMISEGNNTIITFAAFPGLKESLGLDDNELKNTKELQNINFSNKVTIEAYTDKFELNPIMITATSSLPNLDKIKAADTIDELKTSLSDLNDATNRLVDGTGKLDSGIQTAKNKLSDGLNLLNSSKMDNALGLINDPHKVYISNKLLNDAFYAQKLDVSKAGELLNLLNDDNFNKAASLAGCAENLIQYKALLNSSLVYGNKIMSDEKFNEMIKSITSLEAQYGNLPTETKTKVDTLVALGTTENLIKAQRLIGAFISTKGDFNELEETANAAIAMCPGNNDQEKTAYFLNTLNNSIKITENLLSDENINKLTSLQKDVPSYASSYLVLKAELAASYSKMQDAGFNSKKQELEAYVKAVYGPSDPDGANELINYIENITLNDISSEAIIKDVQKIGLYKEQLPSIINEMQQLKALSPILSALTYDLSKEGEITKLSTLFTTMNDESTQNLLNSLGDAVLAFSDEEINTLCSLINSSKEALSLVEVNKENIEIIKGLMNNIQGEPQLMNDINNFSNSLDNCENLINELQNNKSSFTKENMNTLKDVSSNLLSMQQDLKDGDSILKVLQSAMEEGNVQRAKSLVASLPVLQNGINELSSGSSTLKDGMIKFQNDGINKLYDTGNKGISSAEDLLKAKDELVNMSNDYMTFTAKDDNMDGSVKFIMKTAEISYEEPEEEEDNSTENTESKGFFEKIVDFFKNLF